MIVERLDMAIRSFESAECFRKVSECNKLRRLVILQSHILPLRIVGLRKDEVRSFLLRHSEIRDSVIVADFYGLNDVNNWADVVLEQSIRGGNHDITKQLQHLVPTSSNFYRLVFEKIDLSLLRREEESNLRIFLSSCEDQELRLRFAQSLQWDDLARRSIEILDQFDLMYASDEVA